MVEVFGIDDLGWFCASREHLYLVNSAVASHPIILILLFILLSL